MRTLTVRLTAQDLAATRFVWSPAADLVAAAQLWLAPQEPGWHGPWLLDARGALDPGSAELLRLLVPPPDRYVPDFLAPPPQPGMRIRGDLAAVAATPPAVVAEQYGRVYPGGLPDRLDALLSTPAAAARIADELGRAWDALVAPYLPRLMGCVHRDIARAASDVASGGMAAALDSFSRDVRWRGDGITVRTCFVEDELRPGGRGLRIVPSVFAARGALIFEDDRPPCVLYPARGRALTWAASTPDPGELAPLAALIGSRRAQILAELTTPRGTTDLAKELGVTAGGVSRHLSVLADAGLVVGSRFGRRVHFELTESGRAMLDAPRGLELTAS